MYLDVGRSAARHGDWGDGPYEPVATKPVDWTIILPFFNELAFLPATLRSVAKFDCPVHLVLIDNGSTDGSGAMATQLCRELGIAHQFVTEPCPGKVHALRAGLAQVRTPYVATFDADTIYPADYLSCAARLLAQPGVVAAGAYYTPKPERGWRDLMTGAHICVAGRLLGHQCHAGGAGQAFRTDVLRLAGGFDATRWNLVLEDHEIMHRVGHYGRVAYGMDFWCHPSPRERDRESIRWTLIERLAYHVTPARRQARFFYDFLGPRLRERKLSSARIRERSFQSMEESETAPKLVVCADDFGLTPGISGSIASLARHGKLNAISCMTLTPGWARDAEMLRTLPATIQIGLHITLTDEEPLTAMPRLAWSGRMPSCDQLGRRALLRRLPLGEIRAEVAAQFERFVDVHGRPPDFVDGHQHVHVLRGIREVILAETARRAPNAWIRNCQDRPAALLSRGFPLKALANAVQSRGVRDAAKRFGLHSNDSFAGLYDFSGDYAEIFPKFLNKPGSFHLVICHPGSGQRADDSIADARLCEAAALRQLPIHEMAVARGLRYEAAAPMM